MTQTGRIGLGYCPESGTFFGVYVDRCQGEDPLSGPEYAMMGALGGWRQDKGHGPGSGPLEMSGKWTKEGSVGASEGWLPYKHWVSLEPTF